MYTLVVLSPHDTGAVFSDRQEAFEVWFGQPLCRALCGDPGLWCSSRGVPD